VGFPATARPPARRNPPARRVQRLQPASWVLNGGPELPHTEAFSYQIATDTQKERDRYWNAIVSSGGEESACGWCKDLWGISWQITPRVLTDAMAGGGEAKRAFAAMMEMDKIGIAKIEAARRG
jgi:predicted 3-demethylubiquinone-9 3-methyltransferase (glyoxalase superfamily)